MERLFEGVARVFAAAAVVAVVCGLLAWFGVRPGRMAGTPEEGTR